MGYQSLIGLKGNSVQLDKLVIITTSSTASASELVISGLMPYLNMKLIGSKTHGKPVGMQIEGRYKTEYCRGTNQFPECKFAGV